MLTASDSLAAVPCPSEVAIAETAYRPLARALGCTLHPPSVTATVIAPWPGMLTVTNGQSDTPLMMGRRIILICAGGLNDGNTASDCDCEDGTWRKGIDVDNGRVEKVEVLGAECLVLECGAECALVVRESQVDLAVFLG
jgi:hypothetical protein